MWRDETRIDRIETDEDVDETNLDNDWDDEDDWDDEAGDDDSDDDW